MRPTGDDPAHIQVLEAVLIALIMIGAVGFVISFSLPTTPNEPVLDALDTRADDALSVLNELPVDDTRYGNNLLSYAIAQALQGDSTELETRLKGILPPATKFNVYLYNGDESYLIYYSGEPRGERVTATQIFEPAWSHTFVSRDSRTYSAPNTMGVYALPVFNSNVVDDGGVPIEVVAEFSREGHTWETRSFYSTVQGARDVNGDRVGSVVYGSDASGDAKPFYQRIDPVTGLHTGEKLVYVTVEETEGGIIPAGTQLNVRVPQGLGAWYNVDAAENDEWTLAVGQNVTDVHTGGVLVATLKDPLSLGKATLTLTAEFRALDSRPYDFYVLDATLAGTRHGKAEIVLQDRKSSAFTGGDYIELYASVPKPMGWDAPATWTLTVASPAFETSTAAPVRLNKLEIRQPDGLPVFGAVTTSEAPSSEFEIDADSGNSVLTWTPAGALTLESSQAYPFVFEVTPNEHLTRTDDRDYLVVPVTVNTGADLHTQYLTRRSEPGLFFGQVPPQDGSFAGYTNAPAVDNLVTAAPTYRGQVLSGSWVYNTTLVAAKDLYSTVAIDVAEREVPLGGTAEIDVNVENVVTDLLMRGIAVETRTRIYAPWSMDEHRSVFDRLTVDNAGVSKDVTAIVATDVTNDGVRDLIVGTSGGRLLGFDVANDGSTITGLTRQWAGQSVTDVASLTDVYLRDAPQTLDDGGVRANANDPAFVVGLTAESGLPTLGLLDPAFADALPTLPFMLGAFNVNDVEGGFDLDGDGYLDYSVGDSHGTTSVLDGDETTTQRDMSGDWPKANNAREGLVEWGYTGSAAEPTAIMTSGLESGVKTTRTMDQTNTTNPGAQSLSGPVIDAAKAVSITQNTDGLFGYDKDGALIWAFPGGGFRALQGVDLNADDITDIVAGTSDGYVYAINGTQPSLPWEGLTILTGTAMTDADFTDINNGWVVDTGGTALMTTDGFTTRNYTNEMVPLLTGAHGVDLITSEVGFVVGSAGQMWKSTDGGYNAPAWAYEIEDALGVSKASLWGTADFEDVEFHDAMNGLVVGQACTGTLCLGKAIPLHTTDGGATWIPATTVAYTGLDSTSVHRVHFADIDRAYAVGDMGNVLRSTGVYNTKRGDGTWIPSTATGATWIDVSPSFTTLATDAWYGIDCIDEDVCWVAGTDGRIARTTDGGTTWTAQTSGVTTTLMDVDCYDIDNCVAVGESNVVLLTRDSGLHWVLTPGGGPLFPNWNAVSMTSYDAAYFFGGNNTNRAMGITQAYWSEAVAETVTFVDATALGFPAGASIDEVEAVPYAFNGDYTTTRYDVSTDDGGHWTTMVPSNDDLDILGLLKFDGTPIDSPGSEMRMRITLNVGLNWTMNTPIVRAMNVTYKVSYPCASQVADSCRPAGLAHNYYPPSLRGPSCDAVTLRCWELRNATIEVAGKTDRDASKTTADWSEPAPGMKAEIRLPRVQKFWTASVLGRVNDLDASRDMNADGINDVAVAVGPIETMSSGQSTPTDWSTLKVVVLDGHSGYPLVTYTPTATPVTVRTIRPPATFQVPANTVPEPWRIRFADVDTATTDVDGVPELAVALFDHATTSLAGTSRLVWLDPRGLDPAGMLLDTYYLQGRADVLQVTDIDTNDGVNDNAVVGTTSYALPTGQITPGLVYVYSDVDDPNLDEWGTLAIISPESGGRYSITWPIEGDAQFGPYVVESEVQWVDEAGQIEALFLVDYFVVTPQGAK
ncbi:MAG TPA: hypothetical protein VI997_07885, partial [Candidatus Thermoplasmatota archaeon]|nr:hypothetical protein [Candidatus Thermoplasmatota archaeon]